MKRLAAGNRRSGQALVEFSVVAFLTVIMLLFVIELGRMVLVVTAVSNAARAGVRYAIVHGSTRAMDGTIDGASGPGDDPAQVLTVVNNFASAGLLSTGLLVVHVTYQGSNGPGNWVNVSVVYPYNPLTTYFSSTLNLASSARGVIVF